MKTVFIDGSAGTTGLRIFERLGNRHDIALLTLPESERKDPARRKEMLNRADIAFLCLPDDAAREAVSMIENPNTVVIDTSTAHRTNPDWAYALPELSPAFEEAVKHSKRIAVPGCHASGFIALIQPLVSAGFLSADTPLCCHSITGYSGGGKKMIAQYQDKARSEQLGAPRQYALGQSHKHLPEMQAVCGLSHAPIFSPIVADFYSGMAVTVPLFAEQLQHGITVQEVIALYRKLYTGPIVTYCDTADEDGMLAAAACSGKDNMEITVFGNEQRLLLTARYDNLGKGASGAAIEALNLLLDTDPTTGLIV